MEAAKATSSNANAQATLTDFWSAKIEKTKIIVYKKDDGLGMELDAETGQVNTVVEGGVSDSQGLVEGSRFLTVDGEAYTAKLLRRKLARQQGFVAMFRVPSQDNLAKLGEGVWFGAVRFNPGIAGLAFASSGAPGRVAEVIEDGQAAKHGITSGMIFKTVDGEPFKQALWDKKRQGQEDFDVTFIYGDASTTADEKRNAMQLVSRCSRCYSFPEEKAWSAACSWQLEKWWPEFARVADYVALFGLEADGANLWKKSLEDSAMKFSVVINGHVKKGGQNWYMLDCCLTKGSSQVTSWPAPRTLSQLLSGLYNRIREGLDKRYDPLFEDAPFADPSGPSGTTAKLQKWMSTLAALHNEAVLSPAHFALTMFFLCAPVASVDDVCAAEAPPSWGA